MRFETIKEVSSVAWCCPGTPFLFDIDAVAGTMPEGIEFGVGIAEEYKSIFMQFDKDTDVPLTVTAIEDGLNLSIKIPGDITADLKGRKSLIWIVYELRDGEPFPHLKGPIKVDGDDYFTGFKRGI